jgi:hypothetical protein
MNRHGPGLLGDFVIVSSRRKELIVSSWTRESSRASNIQCSATFSYALFTNGSLACAARCLASSAFRRQVSISDDIGGGSSNAPNQAAGAALANGHDRRAVARERHGLFRCGASAAAHVRRPSIQNIRERNSDHVPPGPNTRTLNIQPLGQFRPAPPLSVSPSHIA